LKFFQASKRFLILTTLMPPLPLVAAPADELLQTVSPKVIDWRRHIHKHPELSNREFNTAKLVAEHLRQLGLEVQTQVAHTGVVALLKGKKPGPTVALRADMDALPVTERVDLPFASKQRTTYQGVETGIMHACGHDAHVAMLMGAAQVLAGLRDSLQGNVMFIFQPAEEGAPKGEQGGAELMLQEGIFAAHKPDAIFGLHVTSSLPVGLIGYRKGPFMASADRFEITINGKQTHGARPWNGVDPIVTAAQVITSIQTIISRQVDITKEPAIVSFGKISGGVRNNIIPEQVELIGTIRNFDMDTRQQIFAKIKKIATHVAASVDASADVEIFEGYPVTSNDPDLTALMLPTLREAAGTANVMEIDKITGAEDFSFYANQVPGLYFFLGVTPKDQDFLTAPSNHSPLFFIDESALAVGTKSLVKLTTDYMNSYKNLNAYQ
jgi:amidohydrolase